MPHPRPLLVVLLALVVNPALAAPPDDVVLQAMRAEVDRAGAALRLNSFDPPYFSAARLVDHEVVEVNAKVGALFPGRSRDEKVREVYVEVRVGSYDFDNFSSSDDSFNTYLPDYTPSTLGPREDVPDAIRQALWLLTDSKYKEALSTFNRLKGERVYAHEDGKEYLGFARGEALRLTAPEVEGKVDRAAWEKTMRDVSGVFLTRPQVFDSHAQFRFSRVRQRLVNTEGAEVVTARTYYEIHVEGNIRGLDGMLIEHGMHFYSRDGRDLPDREALLARTSELADLLVALRAAPTLEPYTGPAILSPRATGVFFHETMGHRLEGERQNKDFEGKTFKSRLGERILPAFLTVYDDPTVASFQGTQLFGHYQVDEEGVKAQRATLIDQGVLKGFLMSRQTVGDAKQSNGHGRAAGAMKPMSRMGNLFVESSQRVGLGELKARLIEEVRKRKAPYGLLIEEIRGGDTNTSTWGYQAFRDIPSLMYKVDPQTGAETLVRGVDMVGTPLISLNRILATSDSYGVFNGHCGAESGYVPVSAIAPATLFEEIELQRSSARHERDLILPAPYAPGH
jgi:predicted Zn-dependent protease